MWEDLVFLLLTINFEKRKGMCHVQEVFDWNLEKRTNRENGRNFEEAKVKFKDRKSKKIRRI